MNSQCVFSYAELKRNAERFINESLFAGKRPPSQFNRRFSLTRQDYCLLVGDEQLTLRRLSFDTDRIIEKMSSWQALHSNDSFFFRPFKSPLSSVPVIEEDRFVYNSSGQDGFLFVYQSAWQKRLLHRYGGLCLLEPAYRTAKYPIAAVFLVYVRSNAEYVVIAVMAMQYEDERTIAEALQVLKDWNLEWKPWSFLVDFSISEVKAVKHVFAGCE